MTDQAALRTDLTGTGALLATATAAKSGSTVTVQINSTVVTVQVARDLTVASGDVVILNRIGGQWFAVGRAFSAAPGITGGGSDAPQPGGAASGVLTVPPVETRSYRNGAWRTDRTDVYQGSYGGGGNHTGCAFYGTLPRSLVGSTVTAATIHVRRLDGGAYAPQATTIWLVTEATRPGGAPTLTSTSAGPSLHTGSTNDTFSVPVSWVQAMVGGTAGGLGFFDSSGSPYVIFAGNGSWSPAFTMSIYWTR